MSIELPPQPHDNGTPGLPRRMLTILADGAKRKPYIKSLTINGRKVDQPIIHHKDIVEGGTIVFEMSDKVEAWGNSILVRSLLCRFILFANYFTDSPVACSPLTIHYSNCSRIPSLQNRKRENQVLGQKGTEGDEQAPYEQPDRIEL